MSGRFALATGAGKDATLALHRAREAGLRVDLAFTFHDRASGRVPFHGTRLELVRRYAGALGLELVARGTGPDDFEAVYLGLLDTLVAMGVEGVVYGNIHLADVRAWFEERTTAAGLDHREPLWGEPPSALVREVVRLGYRATVVGVDLSAADPAWLGRTLDADLVAEMEAAGSDPCGERGEYHTFVRDGPHFRGPVPVRTGVAREDRGHRLLDLLPAGRSSGPRPET